jgi:thiamine biosynthesis lipoprotein
MLEALTRAWFLHDATAGAFDPTVLGALVDAGYDRTFPEILELPDRGTVPPPQACPGLAGAELDLVNGTVTLAPGTCLDLGGIGKGLAGDLVVEGLLARGARSVCLSLAGDVRVGGSPPEPGAWAIPVEDPFDDDRVLFTRALSAGAIVTSTTRFHAWSRGGGRQHHLIDPRTGRPATSGVTAVVATAGEAWRAEGFAKAAVVLGAEAGAALLTRAHIMAWLFSDDGAVLHVAGATS